MLEIKKIAMMLKSLEKHIDRPIEMIICGGAAAILAHGMKRTTADVDLVFLSYRPPDFGRIKAEIAESFGVDANWLNEGAKGYADYLLDDFRKAIEKISSFDKKAALRMKLFLQERGL